MSKRLALFVLAIAASVAACKSNDDKHTTETASPPPVEAQKPIEPARTGLLEASEFAAHLAPLQTFPELEAEDCGLNGEQVIAAYHAILETTKGLSNSSSPADLKAAATKIRNSPLCDEDLNSDGGRKLVTELKALADHLDAIAALAGSDGTQLHGKLESLKETVKAVVAAAREHAEASDDYCAND